MICLYITYIDESGKPDWNHPEGEFVLAALIINEHNWFSIDEKVRDVKKKYFPDREPESIEFHAMEIFHRRNAFEKLPFETRIAIFEDVLKVVSNSSCVLCGVIINKKLIRDRRNLDVNALATKFLLKKISYFLNSENNRRTSEGKQEEYNLLMFDSVNPQYNNKVRKYIRTLSTCSTGTKLNRYTIEDPLFINSSYRNLSQLVDCCAYVIHRRFRRSENDNDRTLFSKFYHMLEPIILSRNGKINDIGIKIYPRRNETSADGTSTGQKVRG